MKPVLCIVTGSRAEYGLLRPLIGELDRAGVVEPWLLVTGAHLSQTHGGTVAEIEADGRRVLARVPLPLSGDTETDVAVATGAALSGCASVFGEKRPDAVLVLGDRYESFAAAASAYLQRIRVVHLHGGEVTYGALDEGLRHAITKLASLHFTATEAYRRRVIQMGEHPDSVVAAGALGVDNALHMELLPAGSVFAELGLDPARPVAAVTFHPVTVAQDGGMSELNALLGALDDHPDLQVLLTRPNADAGNAAVRDAEDAWAVANADRCAIVDSLGVRRYLSAARDAAVVVGNSSSGVIETASLGTPAIDVGERQAGRDRAECVVTVPAQRAAITAAIAEALQPDTRNRVAVCDNPYGDGHAAETIARYLERWMTGSHPAYKPFYDLPTTPEEGR